MEKVLQMELNGWLAKKSCKCACGKKMRVSNILVVEPDYTGIDWPENPRHSDIPVFNTEVLTCSCGRRYSRATN